MEMKITKSDWIFLVLCLLLGILGEEAFFRSEVGISYFVFISAFYSVFIWRYRRFQFSHQRLGYLILCCIWLLSASYFLNNNELFYVLNILVIPGLVIFHLVLVTSPNNFQWNKPAFVTYILTRLIQALKYNASFAALFGKGLKQGGNEDKVIVWKKIILGIAISLPILFVVLNLLISADAQFERLIGGIPQWFQFINVERIMRLIVMLILTAAFFGFMQILYNRHMNVIKQQTNGQQFQMDGIIAITVLVIINAVYLLFTVVQFRYFFSGTLQADFTFAEYARKGFFELLFVTLINLSITVIVLTFVNRATSFMRRATQIMLTILVLASSVMLSSAFLRLSMYEEAYGFTFTRVLVHSFMIFLVVIFTYTLVKIWVEKLSLFHFYFITSLIYYTAITVIDLDKIVVKENMNRYEVSGKIDVHYLNNLSYRGVLGLIELYEKDTNIPELKTILLERKQEALAESLPWQSYNLKREQAFSELKKLDIN
ncbi:DUF4153 domain-containing protein [Bacillus sp. AFS031507]|uniref:DUF4153 domain-containing protein n=1 Tax=Bacillus sp. AFS031507 TaxID=2033496 RepID=UPI000BFB1C9D|nr:DUF4173 domain-containing protein [Bacillus sp. AFS031507]PGY12914.1 hypothetical protein COE25_06955 [Bacillus sp. AFS031507]